MNNYQKALKELDRYTHVFDHNMYKMNLLQVLAFNLRKRKNVIGIGAGRMGYSLQAFIMRLNHMGFDAYMIGDTGVPKCDENSLVLINSSSGKTPSVRLFAAQAHDAGAYIVLFTTDPESKVFTMTDIAHTVFRYPKDDSGQVMKTLYEQFTYLMFDTIAHDLMEMMEISYEFLENNHSILE